MPAHRYVHPQNRVAGRQNRVKNALIRLRSAVRLDIGERRAEQALGAIDGEIFGDIDMNAAAVIAPPRIPFRVFVGENRSLRLHHRRAGEVFRSDELEMRFLSRALGFDDGGDFGIDFGESVVGLKHSRLPLRIERKNRRPPIDGAPGASGDCSALGGRRIIRSPGEVPKRS